jgi:hypothetical protein
MEKGHSLFISQEINLISNGKGLRILTINRHGGFLTRLCDVGFQWEVLTSFWNRQFPWRSNDKLPSNLSLRTWSREVEEEINSGAYDVLVIHTIRDLLAFLPYRKIPKIFVAHIALYSHGFRRKVRWLVKRFILELAMHLGRLEVCAISEWKMQTWNIPGAKVIPTPPSPTQPVQIGLPVRAVIVGNRLMEREEIDRDLIVDLLGTDLPISVLGDNSRIPKSVSFSKRSDFLEALSRHQIFIFSAKFPFEDGYNLAMLEAMQSGMAVVGLRHPRSLIEEGKNGYQCRNSGELAERVRKLIQDPALVRRFGERSKQIVAERFPPEAFVRDWTKLLYAAAHRSSG